MDRTTEAVLVRLKPLTESSVIVDLVTSGFGLISAVAKGARKPKSTFQGKLDLFFTLQIHFLESRRSNLHTLREVQIIETHPYLRHSLQKIRAASVAAEWIRIAVEPGNEIPEIFRLFQEFIATLNSPADFQPRFLLQYELELLGCLGLDPAPSPLFATTRGQKIVRQLSLPRNGEGGEPTTPMNVGEIREAAWLIERFCRDHLEKVPLARAKLFHPDNLASGAGENL